MDVFSLISKTNAYKVFKSDKDKGTLSHAYLIVNNDEKMLEEYTKVFVKTLMCDSSPYCNTCRTCKLIDKKIFSDCVFYPKEDKIKTDEIEDMITKTYIKPIEGDKKVFVLIGVQDIQGITQNKLLKTLEEPPQGVYIIMSATNTYSLLPTVLSRVKKLEIQPFNDDEQYLFLKERCLNTSKLKSSIRLSDGKIGETLFRYDNNVDDDIQGVCIDILKNLKSSKEIYKYIDKINKTNIKDFFSNMLRVFSDMISVKNGKEDKEMQDIAKDFSYGAILAIIDIIKNINKKQAYNGNVNSLIDEFFVGMLKEKYKWQ